MVQTAANSAVSRTLTLSRGDVLWATSIKSVVYSLSALNSGNRKGRLHKPPLVDRKLSYWFFAMTKYFATVRTKGRPSGVVAWLPLRTVVYGTLAP